MTELQRQVKVTLLRKRISIGDLSKRTCLTKASLHNIFAGGRVSRRSRQAIVNALGTQLDAWPDLSVSQPSLTLPVGTVFIYPSIAEAIDAAADLKTHAVRHRRAVHIIKATPVIPSLPSLSGAK
jgi:hypothetical protein